MRRIELQLAFSVDKLSLLTKVTAVAYQLFEKQIQIHAIFETSAESSRMFIAFFCSET